MYHFLLKFSEKVVLKIRIFHYSKTFNSYGESSHILGRVRVYYAKNIDLGSRSTLNEGVLINASAKVSIGNDVHISSYVIINTGALDYSAIGKDRLHTKAPVTIKDGVWIGSGAIINPGITIGENAVIGAGAVVTKGIPPNCVAVGVPAKVIKEI